MRRQTMRRGNASRFSLDVQQYHKYGFSFLWYADLWKLKNEEKLGMKQYKIVGSKIVNFLKKLLLPIHLYFQV
jgi:hypothetical protein